MGGRGAGFALANHVEALWLIETLDTAALRTATASEPYTRELIAASRGFTRAAPG